MLGGDLRATFDIVLQEEEGDILTMPGTLLKSLKARSRYMGQLRTGFMRAVYLVLRQRSGSLLHCGPPCGSFVFINSHTHKRTKDKPMGCSREYVRGANQLLGKNPICYHSIVWCKPLRRRAR